MFVENEKNMKPLRIAQLSLKILLTYLFVLLVAHNNFGQAQNKASERGFSPGKSYAISDIETIGLYSGNLMLNMPLGSLPAGRGGTGAGIALRYDSKLWDMFVDDVIRFTTTHDMKTLEKSDEGGWKYNYKYSLKLDYRRLGADQGYCTSGNPDSYYPFKLQLVMPDGSRHLMKPNGTTGIDLDGFMNIYPDGRLRCNPVMVTPGQTVTFYSVDGSFLRLEMITDSDENWENNLWTVYSSDGTRISYNPQSITRQQIKDKNDNFVEIIENASDSAYSNHQTTYLRDQLGRKVVIEYEAAANEDRVHSKGVDGADLITRVTWKNISVNKIYFACEMAPSPLDPNAYQNFALNESFRMVDKIYLPIQISGNLYYEFGYNAGPSNPDVGWGEINKVTLPSGAFSGYEYFYDNVSGSGINAESALLNRPTEKNLTYNKEYDGTSQPVTETWLYTPIAAYNALPNLSGVTVTAPDGGTTREDYAAEAETGTTLLEYMKGEVYKSELADGTLIEKAYKSNLPVSAYLDANRHVKYEFTSIRDAADNLTKTAIKEYSRDKNGNVTEVKEYDFVAYSSIPRNSLGRVHALPPGAVPARITKTDYYNGTPDAASTDYSDTDSYYLINSPRVRSLTKSAELQDGSGTPKSRTEIFYDNTLTTGNPTQTKVWDSFKNGTVQAYSNPLTAANSISTTAQYGRRGWSMDFTRRRPFRHMEHRWRGPRPLFMISTPDSRVLRT